MTLKDKVRSACRSLALKGMKATHIYAGRDVLSRIEWASAAYSLEGKKMYGLEIVDAPLGVCRVASLEGEAVLGHVDVDLEEAE